MWNEVHDEIYYAETLCTIDVKIVDTSIFNCISLPLNSTGDDTYKSFVLVFLQGVNIHFKC